MNRFEFSAKVAIVLGICLVWWATGSLVFIELAWNHGIFIQKLLVFVAIVTLASIILWLIGKKLFENPYLFLLLFTACYFLIRLPFYIKPLEGEDTILAEIFVNNPPGPFYWIMGQIEGIKYYNITYHPGISYSILELGGCIMQNFMDFKAFDNLEIATRLRFAFSLYQYVFFVLFILILERIIRNTNHQEKIKTLFGFILIMSVTPIAIDNSVDMQIDGTSGVIVAGAFFVSIFTCLFIQYNKQLQYYLLFIGSIFTGLGKNEWGIMFFIAIAAYIIVELFRKKFWNAPITIKEIAKIFTLGYSGALLGNALNYLFDPVNYVGGLKLLSVMIQNFSVLSSKSTQVIIPTESIFNITMFNSNANWYKITIERLEYIFPLIILIILLVFWFIKNCKSIHTIITLSLLYALALFSSFFISSWGTFIRYFAPSHVGIITTFCLFLLYQDIRIASWQKIIFTTICLLMTIRLYTLEINLRGKANKDYYIENIKNEKIMKTDCMNGVKLTLNKSTQMNYFIKYYGIETIDTLHIALIECK